MTPTTRAAKLPVLILLLVLCSPLYAQRQPYTLFKDTVGLTDKEIRQIDNGEVFTKVLESKDKYGMLVFGAVYVNAPIEKFAGVFRDVEKLQQEKVHLVVDSFSTIGAPATAADFRRMELDRSDIDDLGSCKPGDCDLQIMDVDNLAKLQHIIKGRAVNKYALVNQAIRESAARAMNAYAKGGLKALGSYRDRKHALNLYQAMKDMVDASYYLPKDKAPDIYNHIVEYPKGKMDGVEDIFYWEKIDFGQGPVVRINHVSIFPKGYGAAKLIAANKQLYASKYMRIGLQMYYCIPDTGNPGKPGFYLIQMNDSRLPDFGGLKLSIVRRIATSKAVEGTADTLEIYKRRSEGR